MPNRATPHPRLRRWRPFAALLLSASLAMLTTSQGLHASIRDIQLPQLGEPADAAMSPREEFKIGARITAQIHAAGYALEDPELVEYITRLGWHVASHSRDLPDHLQFFMVRDPRINAFALPGGFIGFNAGLLMAAESESELAGVMAHELAHVTQRHIARTMEGTRVADIATWAAVLAAIIAGSAAPDVVLGALSLGQAATLQRQINYTRNHELEADRIGINTMMRAGFNPEGMVSFFQRLEQQSRLYGSGMPEILRTHPVNTTRIAEARTRAQRQREEADAERPLTFHLMRARARVLTAERPSAALDHFRRRLERTADEPAERYGAALALHELGRYSDADKSLAPLLEAHGSQPNLMLLHAHNQRRAGDIDGALTTIDAALNQHPRYAPLIFARAETLMDAGEADRARQFLLDEFKHIGEFPGAHQVLARAARASGDRAEFAFQSAAYAWRRGDSEGAIQHIDAGLRHEGLSDKQRARLRSFRSEVRDSLPDNWRPEQEQRRRRE